MWKEKYDNWINNKNLNEEIRTELSLLSEEELQEAFYKDIEFGTAGMRGVMSGGTNKINVHTITRATIGLAKYILDENADNKLVVIAYDSRINSKKFAQQAAKVLATFDIEVKIFASIASTPVASFAIRELNACNGIVITASHNPKTDNGFKVYNKSGAQLNLEESNSLIKKVLDTTEYLDFELNEDNFNLISEVSEKIIDSYQQHLQNISINNVDFSNSKYVFSPLYGTSWKFIKEAAKRRGMNFTEVKSQIIPDGNFPGLTYPNPESKDSFKLGLEIAKVIDADCVFTTDPDADRLGIAVKHEKEYIYLNGNEQGILAAVYLLNSKAIKKELSEKSIVLSSIVSTHLVDKIATAYNCSFEKVLTGFKFIGEKIETYNNDKTFDFLFGFEESYGCLVKDFARDKDALQATMLFSEMIAYYKKENLTLVDVLNLTYEKFGYSKTKVLSYTFTGEQGISLMNTIMEKFRQIPTINVGEIEMTNKVDYLNDETNLPTADVIEYYSNSKDKFVYLRPSGTEPKLKIYLEIIDKDKKQAQEYLDIITNVFNKVINNVKKTV